MGENEVPVKCLSDLLLQEPPKCGALCEAVVTVLRATGIECRLDIDERGYTLYIAFADREAARVALRETIREGMNRLQRFIGMEVKHGGSQYQKGCRCDICKAAHTAYKLKAKNAAPGKPAQA